MLCSFQFGHRGFQTVPGRISVPPVKIGIALGNVEFCWNPVGGSSDDGRAYGICSTQFIAKKIFRTELHLFVDSVYCLNFWCYVTSIIEKLRTILTNFVTQKFFILIICQTDKIISD